MQKEQIIQRKILLGQQEVEYFHHIKKVKNINLRIKVDGSVHISAAKYVPLKAIEQMIQTHGDYILAAIQKAKPQEEKAYHEGDCYHFLGRAFAIRLKTSNKRSTQIHPEKKEVEICLPDIENIESRRKEIYRFEKESCEELFPEILERMHELFADEKIPYPELKFRRMKSRWGSCNPSNNIITMNTMLIQAPVSVMEYVMVHELAHLVHPNHSKEFHQLVEQKKPNWRLRKKKLKDFFGQEEEL